MTIDLISQKLHTYTVLIARELSKNTPNFMEDLTTLIRLRRL